MGQRLGNLLLGGEVHPYQHGAQAVARSLVLGQGYLQIGLADQPGLDEAFTDFLAQVRPFRLTGGNVILRSAPSAINRFPTVHHIGTQDLVPLTGSSSEPASVDRHASRFALIAGNDHGFGLNRSDHTDTHAIARSHDAAIDKRQAPAARKQDAGHDRFRPVLIDGSSIRSRLGRRHLAPGRRDLSCRLISPADNLRVVEHAKRDRRCGSDSQNPATGLVIGNRQGFYGQKITRRRLGRNDEASR